MVKCSKNIISANYHSANRNKEVAKLNYENTYEEITRRYYQAVYNYCQVRLKDEYAAEDCTQDVFLLLYRKMNKLKLSENIRAWLYRTADNVIRNHRRKIKKIVPLEDAESLSIEFGYSIDTPFNGIVSEEEYNLLVSYYIEGDSIDKISKEMDKSKAAAFKRIYRIKSRIVQYMHETHKE